MSNNLNLTDSVNEALFTGKNATFTYNGTTYTFSPQGLLDFLAAEGGSSVPTDPDFNSLTINTDAIVLDAFGGITTNGSVNTASLITTGVVTMENLPTSDPGVADQLWIDTANGRVIKVSAG